MSVKLRELIRSVRACKTAADERGVIAKECALIRTAFKAKENPFRHRNIAKLLYIHMLGYPTHFGQMESLSLIASPNFPEKRIGYLGLMILLDEKVKVLMLVTNSLKTDFSHKNPYVIGLALCSLGNICSADMARDLANEVEKFFRHSNAYIRKKACLCAIRIIRKVPELCEEFLQGVQQLLNDKNHAVLLTAVSLIIEMTKIDPALIKQMRKLVPTFVRLLKNLVLAGYVSEYDVVGITDPFLQAKLIEAMRVFGTGDKENSELMNDILAQVAINTEPTKNPGNAILYECVQTIMSIEAESGLRVLAINILGRFLSNRDNNIRYVALNTLCRCVSRDTAAVQRHRNTIVDCLKDGDISIRRRALDLIYALVTKNNVRALVKELLNYLALTSGDNEFKADLTEKICLVVDRFAPSKHWQIDTITQVLQIAGNFTRETVFTDLVALIQRTPTLQSYATYKLWYAVSKHSKSAPSSLLNALLYCVGEFGECLTSHDEFEKAKKVDSKWFEESAVELLTESAVVDFLYKIMKFPHTQLLTREYLLNAAVKLTNKYSSERSRLTAMLQNYSTSIQVELQQRSAEYLQLTSASLDRIRSGILGKMPVPAKKKAANEEKESQPADNDEGSELELSEDEKENDDHAAEDDATRKAAIEIPKATAVKKKEAQAAPAGSLFDLDLFGGGGAETASAPAPAASKPAGDLDFLSDLLSSNVSVASPPRAQPIAAPVAAPKPAASFDPLGDIFGSTPAPAPVPAPAASSASLFDAFSAPVSAVSSPSVLTYPSAVVFDSRGLSVTFSYSRNPSTPSILNVTASFSNSTPSDFTNFDFQVAVLKTVTLAMQPATATTIPANSSGRVSQSLTLNNSMHGTKKLAIRVKIDYQVNGQPVSEQTQIGNFPE